MSHKKALIILVPLLLSSCGGGASSIISSSISSLESSSYVPSSQKEYRDVEVHEREKQLVTDQYNSIYQIFPYSFADGNGDGIGDLRGIIDKLDYIEGLNYTGLWINPIHKSSSYHKYDVDDYYSIDSQFGTLDDYDELVSKCHEKNMIILLDLVVNHSSDDHPWFKACMQAHVDGDTTNQYYDYYNVVDLNEVPMPSGYHKYKNTNFAYEGRFQNGMPDLNLDPVLNDKDSALGNEIRDIMRFWLIDHDVDGFRLDACTSYFTGYADKNIKMLSWLQQEAEKIKSNAYLVGEVWEGESTIKQYYKSKASSLFQFEDRDLLSKSLYQEDVARIDDVINRNIKTANGHTPAPFIANHDMTRLIGAARGLTNKNNIKMLNVILQLCNGCTFSYYGDEIGMAVYGQKDEDYRQAMHWGDKYECKRTIGTPCTDLTKIYPYPTVVDQLADPDSIVNFIRKANLARLQNPELARGTSEVVYIRSEELTDFGVIKRTYNDSSIYLVINLSHSDTYEIDISQYGTGTVVSSLCTDYSTKLQLTGTSTLVVPSLSIAIIK